MDKIHFPYRSSSHLAFLHVVAESGSWERHDLDVEYDTYISSEDAHTHVADGSVEFVGGNHVSTYAARTRGDQWLYLGPAGEPPGPPARGKGGLRGIEGVSDLKEKVVAIRGNHPGLNTWLFLKQHGLDEDRGDVKLERIRGGRTWEAVRDGKRGRGAGQPAGRPLRRARRVEGHRRRPSPHGLVHHHVQRAQIRGPEPGHRRALSQGDLPGHRLFQDPPARNPSRSSRNGTTMRANSTWRPPRACGRASRRS